MKEILLLTKVFFNSSIDFSRKKGKVNTSYIFLFGIGLFLALFLTFVSILLSMNLLPIDIPKHLVIIMCLVIESFVGIMLNFFSMYSVLFKGKDFDFLASSPLKKSSIITAKLLSIFLFSFVVDTIGMIPVIIIYMVKGGTAIGLLCCIVGTIFVAVFPLLISTIVGALIGILTIKLKNGDTVATILYLAISVGLTVALLLSTSNNFLLSADKIIPYYTFLSKSFVNNDLMGLLYFTLINIGATILVIVFTSLIYFPINKAKKNNGDGSYKGGKEVKTSISTPKFLFNKEIKMIIKNPLFLLSTYATIFIMFVLGIVLIGFIGKGFTAQDDETLTGIVARLQFFQTGICVLAASMCIPTYASFSMEGRDNLEQLMVYPLDKREIIRAKIKASIIPLTILLFITNTTLMIIFASIQGFNRIPPLTWISVILLPILTCVSATFIGTLCGLKWIKPDFVDANDILKKSKSMGMTALFSCLLNLGIFGIYFALTMFVSSFLYLGLIVAISLEIIAIIVLAIVVRKKSVKLLEKALIK